MLRRLKWVLSHPNPGRVPHVGRYAARRDRGRFVSDPAIQCTCGFRSVMAMVGHAFASTLSMKGTTMKGLKDGLKGDIVRHRFTVDDYYRMAEIGILGPDDRVELLRGEIYEMSPGGSHHSAFLTRLDRALQKIVADRALIRCQCPVRLDERSEPEPDIALVRPRDDFYASRHPVAEDALLLVEISDSSLTKDRGLKLSIYAAADIPEYWIVDVHRGAIEVFRKPTRERYEETFELEVGRPLELGALPGIEGTRENLLGS